MSEEIHVPILLTGLNPHIQREELAPVCSHLKKITFDDQFVTPISLKVAA